jgi:hypothetical protein
MMSAQLTARDRRCSTFRTAGDLCRAIVAAATIGLVLAPLAVATVLPKAVDFWGMRPNALATRPGALAWTTDLGPSFNGTHGSTGGPGPASKLSWSSWNATGAIGTGDLWMPHEHGTIISWKRYPATLKFSAPQNRRITVGSDVEAQRLALVFTRITVSFNAGVPAHWHRLSGFALKELGSGFYGFDFPR